MNRIAESLRTGVIQPIAESWEWQLKAACRTRGKDLFFNPDGEREPSRSQRNAEAKAICYGCPVMEQCKEYSLAAAEPYGVWGGLTESERRREIADRRRKR